MPKYKVEFIKVAKTTYKAQEIIEAKDIHEADEIGQQMLDDEKVSWIQDGEEFMDQSIDYVERRY